MNSETFHHCLAGKKKATLIAAISGILCLAAALLGQPAAEDYRIAWRDVEMIKTDDGFLTEVTLRPKESERLMGTLEVTLFDGSFATVAKAGKRIYAPGGKEKTEKIHLSADIPDEREHEFAVEVSFGDQKILKRLYKYKGTWEVNVLGQKDWIAGSQASLRLAVNEPRLSRGLEGADVEIYLKKPDVDEPILTWSGTTDRYGTVDAQLDVPDEPIEKATLGIVVKVGDTRQEIEQRVRIAPGYKVLLTTDKPVYQPMQLIHIRALALHTATLKPLADREVIIEVADSKGNKVFKEILEANKFGIVGTTFQLADEINEGRYTVRAIMEGHETEKKVRVERYVLPKFKCLITTGEPFYLPGDKLEGEIQADYYFGKPVKDAEVVVKASAFDVGFHEVGTAEVKTDEKGHATFEIQLPDLFVGQPIHKGNTEVAIEAEITDTADHKETKYHSVTVARNPILVQILPESGTLVPGVENEVYILTSYPTGKPAPADVSIKVPETGVAVSFRTDEHGSGSFAFTPRHEKTTIEVTARDEEENETVTESTFESQQLGKNVLLRTDRPVYKVGDEMDLQVVASGFADDTLFVDIIKNRQTMLTKTLRIEDGIGTLRLPIDASLFGSLQISAYKILPSSEFVRDTKEIFVNKADDLDIVVKTDQEVYRPGGEARMVFEVKDKHGNGKPTALGIDVVDESVYGLAENQPGLLEIYFQLEKELLEPKIEVHGFDMPEVVRKGTEDLPRWMYRLGKAALAPYSDDPEYSLRVDTGKEREEEAAQGLERVRNLLWQAGAGVPDATTPAESILASHKVLSNANDAVDPWGQPYWITPEDPGEPGNVVTWAVVTSGPDGRLGTGDDSRSGYATGVHVTEAGMKNLSARYGRAVRWAILGEEEYIVSHNSYPPPETIARLEDLGGIDDDGDGIMEMAQAGFRPPVLHWDRSSEGKLSKGFRMELAAVGYLDGGGDGDGRLIAGQLQNRPAGERDIVLENQFILLADVDLDGVAPVEGVFDAYSDASGKELPEDSLVKLGDPRAPAIGRTGEVVPPAPVEKPRVRSWFPETLLSEPSVITDENGIGFKQFPIADSITTWRLTGQANTLDGEIGSSTSTIRVFQDFFVDIDLPVALTKGDEVTIPVAVYNYLKEDQEVRLDLQEEEWFELLEGSLSRSVEVPANSVEAAHYRILVKDIGDCPLTVFGYGHEKSDAVMRTVSVKPNGEEVLDSKSDRLEHFIDETVVIPPDAIDGASKILVKVYPGVFSQVLEGMDSILRMPSGCFEQTSSTSYPNILILDYMRRTNQINPEIEMRAKQYINLGYQRLFGYEVEGGGFQAFGNPPANRVLTAYGLLQFSDMAKVHPVDPELIPRTQRWLAGQQNPDGSWSPDENYLHAEMWKGIQDNRLVTTAWIVEGLTGSGYEGPELDKALAYMRQHADEPKDAFTLVQLAAALVGIDPKDDLTFDVLKRLRDMAVETKDEAYFESQATFSFACGDVANIEVTAHAALAFMQAGKYPELTGKILNYLLHKKDPNGTWRSTHATVLAMKAFLTALEKQTETASGKVLVTINGEEQDPIVITPETSDVLRMLDLGEFTAEGVNKLNIKLDGEGSLLYQVVSKYYLPWEKEKLEKPSEPLSITVEYDRTNLRKDETVTCRVRATNNQLAIANMPIIDVGIPPGFKVETEDLDKYEEKRAIEKYSLTGRQLTLYLDKLEPNRPVNYQIRMKARFPLRAKTPESRVYQYYNPEILGMAEPIDMVVEG